MLVCYLWIVLRFLDGRYCFVVQFFGRPAPQRRKRLVAGERQKPGRNLGSAPESSGLTPNVQKYLAYEILSGRRVPDKADEKPKDPHVVAGKQKLTRLLFARRHPAKQAIRKTV